MNRDVALAETAELTELHEQAAQQRAELGASVHALASRLRHGTPRRYALDAVRLAGARLARSAWDATWRAVSEVPQAIRRGPTAARRRGLLAAAVPTAAVGLAAAAVVVLSTRRRRTGRRPIWPGRRPQGHRAPQTWR